MALVALGRRTRMSAFMENIEAKNLAICWRPLGPPGREPERARLAQPCSRDVLQYHHRFWQQQLSLRWLKISTWLPISKKFPSC
jgi:hypothetical protein